MNTGAQLDALKRALRRDAQARRDAAHAAQQDAAQEVAARIAALAPARGAVVAGYLPIRSELDPLPAMAALAALGASLCLPVVIARGRPLAFRRWRPGDATVTAAFGVEIPAEDVPATPTLVLAPLLAFDRSGLRLGYGGGFYDRTLAALRAGGEVLAVGVAHAAQEVDAVPADATDARLDLIVTEREVIRCG